MTGHPTDPPSNPPLEPPTEPDFDPGFDPDAPVIPVVRRSIRVRVVIAIVAIVVGLAFIVRPLVVTSPGPPQRPGPSTPAGEPPVAAEDRIALIAADGGLTIVDRTGRLVRSLTVEATAFRFPAFSPDGTALAAIGATTTSSSVRVFDVRPDAGDADAAPSLSVYASPDRGVIYLSWAPDSQRIGLLTGEQGTLSLRVVSADGAASDEVAFEGQPLYWDWLDGTRLLVHAGGSVPGAFVGEVGIDGADAVGRAAAPGIFQAPGRSADGRYVAFIDGLASGPSSLVIEERGGGPRSAIAELRAASFGWSPVRGELAWIDGGGAAGPSLGPLRVADAAGGVTRTVLDAAVAAFFWSPDGTAIAALTLEAAGGGNVASLAAIPGFNVRLIVLDAANGERTFERIVALSELFEQQLMPFFDQYAKSHRLWSADSRAIVLPLVDAEGAAHLTVIPVDGGPEIDVGPGVLGFWSP